MLSDFRALNLGTGFGAQDPDIGAKEWANYYNRISNLATNDSNILIEGGQTNNFNFIFAAFNPQSPAGTQFMILLF